MPKDKMEDQDQIEVTNLASDGSEAQNPEKELKDKLDQLQRERLQQCSNEIMNVLDKYGMRFHIRPVSQIDDNGVLTIGAQMTLVPA